MGARVGSNDILSFSHDWNNQIDGFQFRKYYPKLSPMFRCVLLERNSPKSFTDYFSLYFHVDIEAYPSSGFVFGKKRHTK